MDLIQYEYCFDIDITLERCSVQEYSLETSDGTKKKKII